MVRPTIVLPRANRLTKKKDFEVIFKKGKGVKDDFLIFKILKNHLKKSRFGFIVSKKVSNKATVRNKIKRRLRDAVFKKLDEIKNNIDVIIVALPGIENKEFSEIQEAIDKFLKYV